MRSERSSEATTTTCTAVHSGHSAPSITSGKSKQKELRARDLSFHGRAHSHFRECKSLHKRGLESMLTSPTTKYPTDKSPRP